MAGSGASLEISSRTSVGSPAGTWQRAWAGWERWATTKRPDAVTPWAWRSQVHFSAFTGRDHGVGHHCGHAGTAEDATG